MLQSDYLNAERARELTSLCLGSVKFQRLMQSAQRMIREACLRGEDCCRMNTWGDDELLVNQLVDRLSGLGFVCVLNVCDLMICW